MHWQIIVALVVMIPVMFLPLAVIWYLNFDSIKGLVAESEQSLSQDKPGDKKE